MPKSHWSFEDDAAALIRADLGGLGPNELSDGNRRIVEKELVVHLKIIHKLAIQGILRAIWSCGLSVSTYLPEP